MQSATISHSTGVTIVQVVGNSNTITPGYEHLELTRYLNRRIPQRALDLLSPYTRSTVLVGRDREMADAQKLLNDPRPILVRVLTAPAGRGKTRFALELCEWASEAGWHAGFVRHSELNRFVANRNLTTWGWQKPTLIVIDYASQQARSLAGWIEELADRPHRAGTPPLRLLLLERTASLDSGWCAEIFSPGGFGESSRLALLDPPEPIELARLEAEHERLALIEDFRTRVAPAGVALSGEERKRIADILSNTRWAGDPLFVLMATLASDGTTDPEMLTLRGTDLAFELARREAGRIAEFARMRGVDPRLATHLVACVTLAQGAQRGAFEAFVEKEAVRLRRPGADCAATVVDVLEQLISDTGDIAPLLPDIIGEGFILDHFDGGIEGVLHCLGHLGGQGLQTMIRCAQDFSPHRPEPLQWLETLLEMSWNKREFLRALDLLLPHNSLTLRSFYLRVTERLAELSADDPSVTPYRRGCALGKLALAYVYTGEHERALQAATDCVALFEGNTANSTPSVTLERALGDAYTTLALILDARQECDRALPAARRAVDFWRKIAPTPRRGAYELAKALQILSRCLGQMGHFPQALESSTEVVRIQREHAAEHVGCADADLAEALLQHAIWQRRAGNSAAALEPTEEAVALYQRLASQQPDLHRAPFAASLRDLGALLTELKHPEPAMKARAHAVRVLRDLDDKHPEAFRSELAAAIQMLNVAQIEAGDLDAALKSAAEAVSLYRPLAARNPDDYGEMFAIALGNLASMYDALGNEPQKAFELMKEAVGVYKDLIVRGHPGATPAFFARHLYRLIKLLDREHHDAQAVELLEQSIDLYRTLAAHDPDARLNLVAFLRQLTVRLCLADRLPQAMKVNRESIHIYRQLTAQGHDEYRPHLATAAHLLASFVLQAEPPSCEESLTLSHEALSCALPCFTRADPTVEQDLVLDICRLYYETSVRLQREPDRELLSTLKTTLESRGAAP